MLNKKRVLIASLIMLISCFSIQSAYAQTNTSYAALDYQDYLTSPMANPQWDPFVQEGFQSFDRQDMQTTIEFLRKALGLGCNSPIVYFKLALGFEAQGSYYSAIQYYELAGAGFKKANQTHRYAKEFNANYGRALYMMGQKDKAYAVLEQASADTKEFWILKLVGQIAMSKGDLDKAKNYYLEALSHPDANTKVDDAITLYLELAKAYFAKDDKTTGEHYYNEILKLDPSNKEASDYVKGVQRQQNQEKVLDILNQH